MAVTVDGSVAEWLRVGEGGATIQVRTVEHEAAARALNSARMEVIRRFDPHYVCSALPAPDGPFFWIDGYADYTFLPGLLAEHLAAEQVSNAVICVPPSNGPLLDPADGLEAVDWVRGDLADHNTALYATEGVESPLPIGDAATFLERVRAARPVMWLLVSGDLKGRVRGAGGRSTARCPT